MKRTKREYDVMLMEPSGFMDVICEDLTTKAEAVRMARKYSSPGDLLVIRRWNAWPALYHNDLIFQRQNKNLRRLDANLNYWPPKTASR